MAMDKHEPGIRISFTSDAEIHNCMALGSLSTVQAIEVLTLRQCTKEILLN